MSDIEGNYGKRLHTFLEPFIVSIVMDFFCLFFSDFTERPKIVKVICQPNAGNKHGKNVYANVIEPIFRNANIQIDYSGKELRLKNFD